MALRCRRRCADHVNGVEPGETAPPAGQHGRLDHFALDCTGLAACAARLEAAAIPFERLRIEARGLTQLNIVDPNGLKVELTFEDGWCSAAPPPDAA